MTPELAAAIPPHLERCMAALAPWKASAPYLNFAEHATDTSTAFSADTFAALQAVKAQYDPDDVIHANHAIAPPAAG